MTMLNKYEETRIFTKISSRVVIDLTRAIGKTVRLTLDGDKPTVDSYGSRGEIEVSGLAISIANGRANVYLMTEERGSRFESYNQYQYMEEHMLPKGSRVRCVTKHLDVWKKILENAKTAAPAYVEECLCKLQEIAALKGLKMPLSPRADRAAEFIVTLAFPMIAQIYEPGLAKCAMEALENNGYRNNDGKAEKNFKLLRSKTLHEAVRQKFGDKTTSKLVTELTKVLVKSRDGSTSNPGSANPNRNAKTIRRVDTMPVDQWLGYCQRVNGELLVRKDENFMVVNAACKLDLNMLNTLGALKVLGYDAFYRALPTMGPSASLGHDNPDEEQSLRELADHLSQERRERLFDSNDSHYLRDTVRQWGEYKNPEKLPKKARLRFPEGITLRRKFKDLKELHDDVSRQYREIEAAASNIEIEYTERELECLDGIKLDDLTLELPKETAELAVYGGTLNHCIASYGKQAAQKSCILLAVKKDDKLLYNLELRSTGGSYSSKPAKKGDGVEVVPSPTLVPLWSCSRGGISPFS